MKYIFCFLFLFASYVEAIPQKDSALVELLQHHQIRLIVMRHGEAIHNLQHLMSSTKSPGVNLTPKGIAQVIETAQKLSEEKISIIYVSPVYRTLQTAELVGTHMRMPYQKYSVVDSLKEQYFGEYEDRAYDDYVAYFPKPEDVHVDGVPGGESGSALFERVHKFLWKVAKKHRNETVLIVSHAYPCMQINKCLTNNYDNVPKQAEFKIYDFSKN